MKRLIGIVFCAFLFIGMQALINCSTPLESDDFNTPNPPTPPAPEVDTVFIYDTTFVTDTVFDGDTLYITDTVETIDSVYIGDTLYLTDTVEVIDSIYFNDTLYVTDTLQIIDTLTEIDTFYVSDTIMVVDTLTLVDTTYVEVPGEECPFTICSYISSSHKKIYWRFPELDGQYELKFIRDDDAWYRGGDDEGNDGDDCGNNCPLKKLKIHINKDIYFWEVGDDKTFTLNKDISPDTFIKIFPYTSKWCRHKLDICLKITPID